MAVCSNFENLVENLKLDEPWLPPRPWESITSESGESTTSIAPPSSDGDRLCDLSSVSEASLVRMVMYALQGVQSAVVSIEEVAESFCADPADRSLHRIPSLWTRALSTFALGKMLRSIGCTGSLVFLLHKFVNHFTSLRYDRVRTDMGNQNKESEGSEGHPANSLVNQAFAVAVEKVLQGYTLALDTVNASALSRRSSGAVDMPSNPAQGDGNLTSVVHTGATVLEVFLHTKELRTQIEALGNLCGAYNVILCFPNVSLNVMIDKAEEEFCKFPRGGDLLTLLYNELVVADPVHTALLKFLFGKSLEPYCGFIRTWIYEAKISDPYEEFIIECKGSMTPLSHGKAGIPVDFPFATVRVREGSVAPSFMKDFTVPLLRAGQQLQIVLKLLEICKYNITGDYTFEDILPNCSNFKRANLACTSALSFNNREIEDTLISRKKFYKMMLERLDHVMKNFDIDYHQVGLHGTDSVHFDAVGEHLDSKSSVIFDESLIPLAATERKSNEDHPDDDSEASSINGEFSYAMDPLESSECSSVDDFVEQEGFLRPCEHLESLHRLRQNHPSFLSFSSSNTAHQSLQSEEPKHKGSSLKTVDLKGLSYHIIDSSLQKSLSIDNRSPSSGSVKLMSSETQYENSECCPVWPLGGLQRNPLEIWTRVNAAESSVNHHASILRCDALDEENLCLSKQYRPNCMFGGLGVDSEKTVTRNNFSSVSSVLQAWNSKGQGSTLSMNPMFARHSFHAGSFVNKETSNLGRSFPCFDFSSLADPVKLFVGKSYAVDEVSSGFAEFGGSAFGHIDCHQGRHNNQNDKSVEKTASCGHRISNSKKFRVSAEEGNLNNVSGGSGWETLLNGYHHPVSRTVGDLAEHNVDASFKTPLDLVISKCLLEEVLLQYTYVSRLTIMLLEEGFGFQEHLLTLQRYHFMQTADWTDLFITSLWHHKWCFKKAEQKIPEIQGLLESSIQRSSCEGDPNKDRLYIYVKDRDVTSVSFSATGVHSFNFIGLGYRVDWPISIIVSPDTLRMYAEIFSFLIQVKLSILSSTDLWCSMKDVIHILSHASGQHGLKLSDFHSLIKLRHLVHHFVSTLEQYVLSHLSDVSWCRLRNSLQTQVQDLMDIQSVHMAYLTDSMHICFLADETRSTSNTIGNILQCALDLSSCLTKDLESGGSHNNVIGRDVYKINNSQILSIKQKFDVNLQQLHLEYLRCPKHGEFGLARFWSYLNYNGYYSDPTSNQMFGCSPIV